MIIHVLNFIVGLFALVSTVFLANKSLETGNDLHPIVYGVLGLGVVVGLKISVTSIVEIIKAFRSK